MEQGAGVRVRKVLGRELESTLTIVEYDPPRRFATEVASGLLSYRVSLELEPDNGSTKVQFVLEGEPGGFFSFDEPVVEEQVRNQIKDDFRSLKIRLETGAAWVSGAVSGSKYRHSPHPGRRDGGGSRR